jgi:hypothetical protein
MCRSAGPVRRHVLPRDQWPLLVRHFQAKEEPPTIAAHAPDPAAAAAAATAERGLSLLLFCVFTRKSETSRSYTSTARVREPPTRRRPTQQRAQASRQAQEGGAGLLFGRPGAPYDGNKRARRRTPNSSSIDHYRHHAHQQIQIGTSPIGLFRWSLGHPLGELFLQLGDL